MGNAVHDRIERAHEEIVNHKAGSAADHQHPVFCQIALPTTRPEARTWERRIGKLSMRIDAGVIADDAGSFVDMPLPYGRYPRLILMHMNNEAMRRPEPVIEIDRTLTDFAAGLGLDTNGAVLREIRQQLCNLAVSTLRVWHNGASLLNGPMVENTDFTMRSVGLRAATSRVPGASRVTRQEVRAVWPKRITINRAYFQSVRQHGVVLDRRAVVALMHSASALDAYSWLCYSLNDLAKGEQRMSRWADLHHQFGQGYRHESHFRAEFKKDLVQVQRVYPSAVVVPREEGIVLHHSPPPGWQRTSPRLVRPVPMRRTALRPVADPVSQPAPPSGGQTQMLF